jgi:transcription-repair coupling factor (superfamily II helicase)
LSAGAIDIVIGTHKLLNTAFSFRNSARHHRRRTPLRRTPEERLRTLRAEVDVLTLTAT